ncbi:MAG: CPBP family intramembrane metalloprotease [Phycisphaerales bacterium]|jgi:membrane protease YdiL (CAAX protease family)|nr:CPBP family intramembrane metalloprotease [Phycisphaerales bacterium]
MAQPIRFAKQSNASKQRYSELSREPLYVLLFLLPLILFYEFALYSTDKNIQIKAHDHLVRFFEQFDMPPTKGLWLGGIAILTIFLIWHIVVGNRWVIKLKILVYMAIESIVCAIPLLLFGAVLGGLSAVASNSPVAGLSDFDKIAVSIGAGLYEELVFRMLIIALVHTVVCSFFKQSELAGLTIGVIISSILFALYHDLPNAGSLSAISLFFFGIAGLYLGILYVTRGFGIAAATHAVYDIVATTILAAAPS